MAPTTLSYAATTVLQAIVHGYQYGFDIIGVTGLPAGTVYPILRRLDDAGYLNSRWEEPVEAHQDQRPARKYYEVTRAGREALAVAVVRFPLLRPPQRQKHREPRRAGARHAKVTP